MARRSIYVDGFSHKNPIPAACVVNGLLFTGTVHGRGPDGFSERFADQCAQMFKSIEAILTEAGGSLDDIAKVSVRLADDADRDSLNDVWCRLFADPAERPARQVTIGTTSPYIQVQCEVFAVLTDSNDGGGNGA